MPLREREAQQIITMTAGRDTGNSGGLATVQEVTL